MSLIDLILFEAKQRGTLYHFTSVRAAVKIIQNDILKGSDVVDNNAKTKVGVELGVSLTRDKIFHKTADRKFDAVNSVQVRIALDGDKLSAKYKIIPYNFWINRSTRPINTESEELVLVKDGIKPIIPFILKVDILSYNDEEMLKALITVCKSNNILVNEQ